jgi:hypothetical protein
VDAARILMWGADSFLKGGLPEDLLINLPLNRLRLFLGIKNTFN